MGALALGFALTSSALRYTLVAKLARGGFGGLLNIVGRWSLGAVATKMPCIAGLASTVRHPFAPDFVGEKGSYLAADGPPHWYETVYW